MSIIRDTGDSLDIGCKKFAAPEMLTGEHALVEHIPDDNMTYLRPAELEIECEPRHVVLKAIVVGPKRLDREKYVLENQTNELLESNLQQNGLPKLEIENATQVSSPRRKEVEEKSISLTNEVDKIVFEGNLVENVEILVASFTKDDKDTMNSIKINVHEITEALLKNEESAPSIQKIEKGMNNESGRSTHAIRRGIFAKSSVDRSTGHPAGNKYIKSDMCTMRQYRFLIHPPCGSFVADRRGFPKEIEPDKGSLFMNNRVISNIGNLLSFTNAI
ncbi:hypothetical protein TNCT_359951 [Trichonephila clavata]|uniref:Uncharacterized protein n=1 Tax=Trichonephila clavata TaxID=2740835 RepID=A0A8X6J361_TRICU|nr:hypothetical protein TNCT_359951 [Trichonephila clavata]